MIARAAAIASTRAARALLVAAFGAFAAGLVAGCRHPVAPGAAPILVDAGDGTALPRSESLSLVAGGVARHLIVHLPGGAATTPRPLVLNLHGSGGDAAQQEAFAGMDSVAEANQFIVAYPEGAIALGGGFAWNVPGQPLLGGGAVPTDAADDVAFFAQAIAFLQQRYAIDPHRIFVTGMSGGARMTSQLGCDLATTVAAIAPVAGLRFPSPCNGTRAVPVVAFHGTADTVNPYDGGGQPYWTYSVPSAEAQWGAHDGCDSSPATSPATANVTLTAYGDCTGGAAVALYTVDGAGHEWPGAPGQTPLINASATMWSFFNLHPKP